MIRRLAVTAAAVPLIVVVELCRRGYGGPILFGCRQWLAGLDFRQATEPDLVA